MAEDSTRLVAWAIEMQRVHDRLRAAVEVVRDGLERDGPVEPPRDLLLHCWGFCQALSGHHRGEDHVLFPDLRQQRPDLAATIEQLEHDHSLIEQLLGTFTAAVDRRRPRNELLRHLDGIGAIMESHFGFEERSLLGALGGVQLDVDPGAAFGPLA